MIPINQLFYGDNLGVLREHIADESVDLIYLDPPFNSNDMMAYLAMMAVRLIELHRVLKPTGSLYLHCDPTASHYLKLILDGTFGIENYLNEIIWRRTGAHNNAKRFGPVHDVIHFYQKSEHYRHKAVYRPYANGHIDSYFRKQDERGRYWTNSIHGAGTRNGDSGKSWRGYNPTASKRHWAVPNDLVLAFGVDPKLPQHEKLDALADMGLIDFPAIGSGALPTYRQYLDRSPGNLLQDIWAYQPHTRGALYGSKEGIDEDVRWLTAQGNRERLGYPTQKPVGLLERILSASSDPGAVVLDPFCGCGTAVHAAQRMGRQWIGIDITYLSIGLIERRLMDAFPGIQFSVVGEPSSLSDAEHLASVEPHQFQYWITQKIGGQPYRGGRKGPDRGVDGYIYYTRNAVGAGQTATAAAIISVKAGRNVGVAMVRDLRGVLEREKSDIGVFVCVTAPSRDMEREAAAAGIWTDPVTAEAFPRVQLFTLAELFQGRRPRVPLLDRQTGFRRAAKDGGSGQQASLF
ncbi:DNA methyltransferase [Sphingomonas sp. Y38-1Y]|uniref:DNA methyltransferase n=1 Tax=Sphingomonas sp. Y38-1Y TaxID=3078265 RepID=UPI0028EDEC0D|nr:DNA methyltransferase [Sphingomonas sp. Y38-1Y]